MAEHHITIPDDAEVFVQEQIAAGKFATPSEVLLDAIEQARIRQGEQRLTELVREGLEAPGEGVEYTDEWFEQRMDDIKAESTTGDPLAAVIGTCPSKYPVSLSQRHDELPYGFASDRTL